MHVFSQLNYWCIIGGKTPTQQRLLSLHDWYKKMKPFTEYAKEEYGTSFAYAYLLS